VEIRPCGRVSAISFSRPEVGVTRMAMMACLAGHKILPNSHNMVVVPKIFSPTLDPPEMKRTVRFELIVRPSNSERRTDNEGAKRDREKRQGQREEGRWNGEGIDQGHGQGQAN